MTEGERVVSEFTGLKPSDPMWGSVKGLAHMIDQTLNDYLVSTIGVSDAPWRTSAELARVKDLAYRRGREIDELKRRLAIAEIVEIATRRADRIGFDGAGEEEEIVVRID